MATLYASRIRSADISAPGYYADWEVNRSIAGINGDFMVFNDRGPIEIGIATAHSAGAIAILDAGCGSTNALAELKNQIEFRAPLEASKIAAVGIDQHDYRNITNLGDCDERNQKDYVEFRQDNLATVNLEPASFDLAYCYEVLIHNENFTDILANLLPSIKSGGTFYCNTRTDQVKEFDAMSWRYESLDWAIESRTVTREFIRGPASRVFHKLVRPLLS